MKTKMCGYGPQKTVAPDRGCKAMDIVDYLSKLEYKPVEIRQFDYWYLSLLRQEKTALFNVNRKLNCWYDHGIGKGGNIIYFAILYNNCTAEILHQLNGNLSFQKPLNHQFEEQACSNIPIGLAEQFCREAKHKFSRKEYFAIGFKNNSGGYELRNPYNKFSSSPKDITTFNNQGKVAAVFEGFFNFLSLLAIQKSLEKIESNFVILNSASFFEKPLPFMEQHDAIRLYLDRDKTGQIYSIRCR